MPFDRRRHGMIIGMGAAGLVVESAEATRERGLQPICEVLSAVTANSALVMPTTGIMNMSGFPPKGCPTKVPAACCEHLAGTAWLADEAREAHLPPTLGEGVPGPHEASPLT